MSITAVAARVRFCGGVILLSYLVCHLSNLWVGLWSLQLMEHWREVVMAPWRTWIGQVLLFGALASHAVLGLVSLSSRRHVARMRLGDIAQFALGLFIPPLLILHFLASRGAPLLDGFQPSHGWFMFVYWKLASVFAVFLARSLGRRQATTLIEYVEGPTVQASRPVHPRGEPNPMICPMPAPVPVTRAAQPAG